MHCEKLLYHPVGSGQQDRRHRQAQRLGGLEIDKQLVFGRLLYRKVGWFSAFENLIYLRRRSAEQVAGIDRP
jgi:hypothetical protein